VTAFATRGVTVLRGGAAATGAAGWEGCFGGCLTGATGNLGSGKAGGGATTLSGDVGLDFCEAFGGDAGFGGCAGTLRSSEEVVPDSCFVVAGAVDPDLAD